MADQPEHSFFWTLAQRAGSQQRENQLSSTFAACFTQSPWFQRIILDVVRRACRIDRPVALAGWVCAEQVCPPKGGRERIDLRLSAFPAFTGAHTFHLESKVESLLTEQQLTKYRKRGAEYLIAVTKHPPEVSERRLRQLGAYALRWQDFHRALLASKPTAHIDRFIRSAFTTFLEELGMAHPEDLTLDDLKGLRDSLRRIRSPNVRYFVPKRSFQSADALLDFMGEVRRQFIEATPKLESYPRRWGPGMGVDFDDLNRFQAFTFSWSLNRNTGVKREFVNCYITLPIPPKAVRFGLGFKRKQEEASWVDEWPLKSFTTKGVVNIDKCVAQLTKVAKNRRLV